MENEIIGKIDKLYDECKKIFTPDLQFQINGSIFKDQDKKIFFESISNFFLQKRQKEVIEREKY